MINVENIHVDSITSIAEAHIHKCGRVAVMYQIQNKDPCKCMHLSIKWAFPCLAKVLPSLQQGANGNTNTIVDEVV